MGASTPTPEDYARTIHAASDQDLRQGLRDLGNDRRVAVERVRFVEKAIKPLSSEARRRGWPQPYIEDLVNGKVTDVVRRT